MKKPQKCKEYREHVIKICDFNCTLNIDEHSKDCNNCYKWLIGVK